MWLKEEDGIFLVNIRQTCKNKYNDDDETSTQK